MGASLERFEVAGPGFVNLFMSDAWLTAALAQALAAGDAFGARLAEHPQRILVEFVSANPTGPMHVGHARNAAYGDALARMLALQGNRVEREFYVNDAGSQVRKLGESLQAIARGEPVPEDGYKGEYMVELAERLPDAASIDAADTGRAAVALVIESIRGSLAAFGVGEFDVWSYESALHEGDPSPVAHTLAILEQRRPHLPQRRGAVAAHDRLRRRQGPRARALERRAHVFRVGHRLPPGQARARFRTPDRRVGRRPSRLCAAHEGGV